MTIVYQPARACRHNDLPDPEPFTYGTIAHCSLCDSYVKRTHTSIHFYPPGWFWCRMEWHAVQWHKALGHIR